jgi:post-segregation antitoxin (ccd killing protein)
MTRNLTIQLDESTIKSARVVAARRSMSISRLVSEAIEKAAEQDNYWQIAKRAALAHLSQPAHLGGGTLPDREALHNR